jgi:hypothetical protein
MIENLPNDLILLIYEKLHRSYMKDLAEEIYEKWDEIEWYKNNNLGDDFDEDYEPSTEESDTD